MNLRYSSLVLALSASTAAVFATPELVDEDTWRFLEGNITDAGDEGDMVMADGGACYDMTVHQCGCGPDECNAALCSSVGRIWTAECPTHCTDCDGSVEVATNGGEDHDSHDGEAHDSHDMKGDDDDDEMAHSSHDHASHEDGEMDASAMESSAVSFASAAAMGASALVGSLLALV